MGQFWNIVNLKAGERHSTGKLTEYLWEFGRNDLVYLFARPVRPSRSQYIPTGLLIENKDEAGMKVRERRCPILSVPDEILLLIFDELDHVSSLRLILTSKHFFRLGWDHFESEMRRRYGLWAGHPVICVGEYCEVDDMPQGFLTEEEKQILNEGPAEEEIDEDEGITAGPASLYSMAVLRLPDIYFEHPYRNLDFRLLVKHVSSPWLSPPQRRFIGQLFAQDFFDYFPVTQKWILRNLTSKEYVRGNGIFDAFQEPGPPVGLHVGHYRYPGFTDAILSRICWSSSSPFGELQRMHRGPWAGHAFEICIEAEHIARSTEDWVDVTQAVVADLALIYNLKIHDNEEKLQNAKNN